MAYKVRCEPVEVFHSGLIPVSGIAVDGGAGKLEEGLTQAKMRAAGTNHQLTQNELVTQASPHGS